MTKMTKNPSTNSIGDFRLTSPFQSVAIQQNTWTPDGMAIMMLAAVKKLAPSSGIPVASIWCTHSPKPMNPVDTSDSTSAMYPKILRFENVEMMVATNAAPGMKMMYT